MWQPKAGDVFVLNSALTQVSDEQVRWARYLPSIRNHSRPKTLGGTLWKYLKGADK
jgi:hypothetical protein